MEQFTNKPRKAREIELTLNEWDVDIWRLRELALSEGGLMNQELRRKAWPKLLGISGEDIAQHREKWRAQQLESSTLNANDKDDDDDDSSTTSVASGIMTNADESVAKSLCESQVDVIAKDVHRCSYISHDNEHKHKCNETNEALLRNIIHGVLYRGNNNDNSNSNFNNNINSLHYYQGFHNISAVMLNHFNNDADLCGLALDRMTKRHLAEFMKPDFRALQHIIEYTFLPLLFLIDPELHDALTLTDNNCNIPLQPCTFVLSWMITLFSHERACIYDARKPEIISRVLDAILAAHPLYSMYVACAVLVLRRDCLLNYNNIDDDVHMLIGGLFSDLCADVYFGDHDDIDDNDNDNVQCNTNTMGVELLLQQALEFMRRVPPDRLRRLYVHRCCSTNSISNYSDAMLFQPACASMPAKIRTDWAYATALAVDHHAALYAYTEHERPREAAQDDVYVTYGECPKGSKYRLARVASGTRKETYYDLKARVVKKRLIQVKRKVVHTLRKLWRLFCTLVLALYYHPFKLAMHLEMAQYDRRQVRQ